MWPYPHGGNYASTLSRSHSISRRKIDFRGMIVASIVLAASLVGAEPVHELLEVGAAYVL